MRKQCDNDSSMGLGIHLSPQCYKGIAQFECEIRYNEIEDNIFYLCESCKNALKKSAKKHSYGFSSKVLKS